MVPDGHVHTSAQGPFEVMVPEVDPAFALPNKDIQFNAPRNPPPASVVCNDEHFDNDLDCVTKLGLVGATASQLVWLSPGIGSPAGNYAAHGILKTLAHNIDLGYMDEFDLDRTGNKQIGA